MYFFIIMNLSLTDLMINKCPSYIPIVLEQCGLQPSYWKVKWPSLQARLKTTGLQAGSAGIICQRETVCVCVCQEACNLSNQQWKLHVVIPHQNLEKFWATKPILMLHLIYIYVKCSWYKTDTVLPASILRFVLLFLFLQNAHISILNRCTVSRLLYLWDFHSKNSWDISNK
jgi:hypothetical protein